MAGDPSGSPTRRYVTRQSGRRVTAARRRIYTSREPADAEKSIGRHTQQTHHHSRRNACGPAPSRYRSPPNTPSADPCATVRWKLQFYAAFFILHRIVHKRKQFTSVPKSLQSNAPSIDTHQGLLVWGITNVQFLFYFGWNHQANIQ